MALDLKNVSPLALLGVLGLGFVALARSSKTTKLVGSDDTGRKCSTLGYLARWQGPGSTKYMHNLSTRLRGCAADPIEMALEEHNEKLPFFIEEGHVFTTKHEYRSNDPRDWPRECKVSTVCKPGKRRSHLRSCVHAVDEPIFGTDV